MGAFLALAEMTPPWRLQFPEAATTVSDASEDLALCGFPLSDWRESLASRTPLA